MRLKPSIFVISVVALAIFCCIEAQSHEPDAKQTQTVPPGRASLVPPKVFDFDRFKTMFRKRYDSVMEEIARKKLFFARAFRAFLSFISYKHYKSSSYQRVNEMSDWTHAELRAIELKRSDEESLNATNSALSEIDETKLLHDLEEIKLGLKGSAEISGEVLVDLDYVNGLKRRKRASNDDKSSISKVLPGSSFFDSFIDDVKKTFGAKPKITKSDLPDEIFIDHRKSNCFAPIKNQGRCGSCYIFSTLALYEYSYCRERSRLVSFSEQYPLDCGSRSGLKGCKGGYEINVSRFFGTYGLELSSRYPYRGHQNSCPYEGTFPPAKMGVLKMREPELKIISYSMLEEFLKLMPVLVELAVSDDFHAYGGGVDLGRKCDGSRVHSMLLLGSGREDGIEYWLFRNSYGDDWGVQGHYKLAKEATNCYLDKGSCLVLYSKSGKIFGPVNKNIDLEIVENFRDSYNQSAQIKVVHKVDTNIVTPAPNKG